MRFILKQKKRMSEGNIHIVYDIYLLGPLKKDSLFIFFMFC